MFLNADKEFDVIALCILNDHALAIAAPIIDPSDISDPRLSRLYAFVRSNPDAVGDFMALQTVPGGDEPRQLILDLMARGESASLMQFEPHCHHLHALAACRRVVSQMHVLADAARSDDVDSFREAAAQFDPSADLSQTARTLPTAADAVREKQRVFATPAEHRSDPRLPTRTMLDDLLLGGGLRRGGLYCIGGLPGAGKSLIVAQAIPGLCHFGRVLFATMEMTRGEVTDRLLIQQSGAPSAAVEACEGWLMRNDAFVEALETVHGLPLTFLDTSPLTIDSIRLTAKSAMLREPVAAVIIDYLQLLDGPGKTLERIEHITRRAKLMANELKCPVILISSFNRAQYESARAPQMRDFRGSGSIESDADACIVVNRPFILNPQANKLHAEVHFLKQRMGKTGVLDAQLDTRMLRIVPRTGGEATHHDE